MDQVWFSQTYKVEDTVRQLELYPIKEYKPVQCLTSLDAPIWFRHLPKSHVFSTRLPWHTDSIIPHDVCVHAYKAKINYDTFVLRYRDRTSHSLGRKIPDECLLLGKDGNELRLIARWSTGTTQLKSLQEILDGLATKTQYTLKCTRGLIGRCWWAVLASACILAVGFLEFGLLALVLKWIGATMLALSAGILTYHYVVRMCCQRFLGICSDLEHTRAMTCVGPPVPGSI